MVYEPKTPEPQYPYMHFRKLAYGTFETLRSCGKAALLVLPPRSIDPPQPGGVFVVVDNSPVFTHPNDPPLSGDRTLTDSSFQLWGVLGLSNFEV